MIPLEYVPFVWAFIWLWSFFWGAFYTIKIVGWAMLHRYEKQYQAEQCRIIDKTWADFTEYMKTHDSGFLPYSGYYITRRKV